MHSCKIFIVNEKMKHLCICQQPKNSDLFKGHGQTPPGGLSAGLQWGWGAWFHEDTMDFASQVVINLELYGNNS